MLFRSPTKPENPFILSTKLSYNSEEFLVKFNQKCIKCIGDRGNNFMVEFDVDSVDSSGLKKLIDMKLISIIDDHGVLTLDLLTKRLPLKKIETSVEDQLSLIRSQLNNILKTNTEITFEQKFMMDGQTEINLMTIREDYENVVITLNVAGLYCNGNSVTLGVLCAGDKQLQSFSMIGNTSHTGCLISSFVLKRLNKGTILKLKLINIHGHQTSARECKISIESL